MVRTLAFLSRLHAVSAAGIALLAYSLLAPKAAALEVKTIAGLWQFEERLVWIRIDADGAAYQCRIASRSPLVTFTSRGVFQSPDRIAWAQHWGIERIEHRPGTLTVHSKGGAFTYQVAKDQMAPECK
jgi:hypothetical protein